MSISHPTGPGRTATTLLPGRMVRVRRCSLAVAILTPLCIAASSTAVTLRITPVHQEQLDWCWDAASQMVLRYYQMVGVISTVPTQCAIAAYALGYNCCTACSPMCSFSFPCNCPDQAACCYPETQCNQGNNFDGGCYFPSYPPSCKYDVRQVLTMWRVSSGLVNSAMTEAALGSTIYGGYPVMILWEWKSCPNSTGGHFLLVTGYDATPHYVYYDNPGDGAAHIALYSYVVGGCPGYDHEWIRSLIPANDPRVIAGQISHGGSPLAGVQIRVDCQGIGFGWGETDSTGRYIAEMGNGAFTVTPSKNGYTFSPATQSVTVSGSSQLNVNFTASP